MPSVPHNPPQFTAADQVAIRQALQKWFAEAKRDLPWRRTLDPYAIWISEVMLQQTQVKTVQPYFERFMELFPTVAHLARADLSRVLKAWEGLGYYSRARNLHKAAQMVTAQFDGRIPGTWEALRTLPGIGEYIGAAVLSIAFGQPFAVVDGNVKRVLSRLRCIETLVNDSGAHRVYQGLAGQLLCPRRPGDHNQAMMELGALVCTPRNPACIRCPLALHCCARQKDVVNAFPKRKPKRIVPVHAMVAGVVVKKGRILLVQRPSAGLLGGLWEFPNGPLSPNQKTDHKSDRELGRTCVGHIASQTGLDVVVVGKLAEIRHTYSHFKLRLSVLQCRWQKGRICLNGPADFAWVRWDQLGQYPLHGAVHKALPAIEAGLR